MTLGARDALTPPIITASMSASTETTMSMRTRVATFRLQLRSRA